MLGKPAWEAGPEDVDRVVEILRANGCDTGQGFLFGEAMAAADVPALIGRRRPGAKTKSRIAA